MNIDVCLKLMFVITYAPSQNMGHIVDWENWVPAFVPVSHNLCLFEVQFNFRTGSFGNK